MIRMALFIPVLAMAGCGSGGDMEAQRASAVSADAERAPEAITIPDREERERRAELRRVDLEQAAVAQSGDAAAMAGLLHPSYVAHLTNGRLSDHAQTLTFVRSGSLAKERFHRTQESVVVAGDTGVVMGLDRLESAPPLATRGERNRRYTNMYVKHEGKWKLLARHFHLLP